MNTIYLHSSVLVVFKLLYFMLVDILSRVFLTLPLKNVQMIDPVGIANWSVTYVDWSERKWHPRSFRAEDVSFELLRNMTVWFLIAWFFFILSMILSCLLRFIWHDAVYWPQCTSDKWCEGTNLSWYITRILRTKLELWSILRNIWITWMTWEMRMGFILFLQHPRSITPCKWNGQKRPCYLFARKFYPDTLEKLINLFSNYAVV